jgi:hypothetical protein
MMPCPDTFKVVTDTRYQILNRRQNTLVAHKRSEFNIDRFTVQVAGVIVYVRLNEHFASLLTYGGSADIAD